MLIVLLAAALSLHPLDLPEPTTVDPAKGGETKNRMAPEELAQIVSEPAALLDKGQVARAARDFEVLLNGVKARRGVRSLAVADTLTAYGLALYERDLGEQSLPYFRRAVMASREATGPDHPEVALALSDLCEVLAEIHPDRTSPEAIDAAEEALRIRRKTLGEANGETGMSYIVLGRVSSIADPTRDRGRAAKAAELIRQGIAILKVATNAEPSDLIGAHFDLAMVYARNGMGPETVEAARAFAEAQAGLATSGRAESSSPEVELSAQDVIDVLSVSKMSKLAVALEEAGGDKDSVEAIRAATPSATGLKRQIERAQQRKRESGLAPEP